MKSKALMTLPTLSFIYYQKAAEAEDVCVVCSAVCTCVATVGAALPPGLL